MELASHKVVRELGWGWGGIGCGLMMETKKNGYHSSLMSSEPLFMSEMWVGGA
jgi:hypothetical protein